MGRIIMQIPASNEWDIRGRKLNSSQHVSQHDILEFVNRAESNPLFFSKYFCNYELSPKQSLSMKYLKEEPKFIGVYNRQGGKSTLMAIYNVHELIFRSYPSGDTDFTIIFAPIKDQSKIIFNKVDQILKRNQFLNSMIESSQVSGIIKVTTGNELQCKTASPNAHIRGFSPTKIQIDESQDVSDVKYYEDILPSGAATGAKIQEIGTPAKRNHFYKTYYRDSSYKRVKQTWKQCPFLDKPYVESLLNSGKMTKARFDQEFNCIWNVDTGSAWSYELINSISVLEDKYYPPEINSKYYAGIDVGRNPAETVLSIGKNIGDELYQVKLVRISGAKTYPEIVSRLYEVLSIYEPLTCVDATKGSQGVVVYDMLVEKFSNDGNYKMAGMIIPEDYNNRMKSEMVNDVELLGETNRLKILNNDGQRRQLIAYEKKTSVSGNDIFYSEELSDICQALNLMVRSYLKHGTLSNQGFKFATSGTVGGFNGGGTSFTSDLKDLSRPSW